MSRASEKILAEVSEAEVKAKKAPKLPVLESLNWLIHLNYVKKDFKSCKDLIKLQLVTTNGLCEYALYVQGLILRQEGLIQESLDLFQSCALLNPTNVQNMKQVARSLFLLGRHKAAIDVYAETLKQVPEDWETTHNLGVCYVHLNNIEKAKSYFKDAINITKHELSFQMLAKMYIKEDNIPAAIDVLTKAVEFNAESCDLLTLLGLLYLKDKQYQKAFEALGNALVYNPIYYKAILAVCNMIQIHNDFDVALNKYRIAADTAPENARLWNNIGMCFFGKKKYVALLKRATYLSPFDWKILYNLGLVHLAIQQYASAFRYLSSAINFKPKESIIYSMLAVCLTHLNDEQNARDSYERALMIDGDNVYTNLNYAVFLYNRGDRKGASARLIHFRKNYEKLMQGKGREVDLELQTIAAKLGPILHLGESLVSEPKPIEPPPQHEPKRSESSMKYETNKKNSEYFKESTIASVSGIAIPESARSEKSATRSNDMTGDDGSLPSARSIYTSDLREKDKQFGNF